MRVRIGRIGTEFCEPEASSSPDPQADRDVASTLGHSFLPSGAPPRARHDLATTTTARRRPTAPRDGGATATARRCTTNTDGAAFGPDGGSDEYGGGYGGGYGDDYGGGDYDAGPAYTLIEEAGGVEAFVAEDELEPSVIAFFNEETHADEIEKFQEVANSHRYDFRFAYTTLVRAVSVVRADACLRDRLSRVASRWSSRGRDFRFCCCLLAPPSTARRQNWSAHAPRQPPSRPPRFLPRTQ